MKTIYKIKSNMRGSGLPESPTFKKGTAKKGTAAGAAILIALILATFSTPSWAALQNNIVGEVERIIVDDPLDTWSRGTMVVGGQNVIIPRNMVIDLPANRLTLQQFFVNAPSACADTNGDGVPDETGLAKADNCNHSFTGATATILANKTNNGNVIAGEIMLEKATELVSGIVTFINYDDGYFRVDGILGDDTTGAMVRVNDPEGRFTHQTGAGCLGSGPNCSADTRYGVDPDNYTFTASTGYPMCIPSTVARGPFDFDSNRNGVIENNPAETGRVAQANPDGTGDFLCPPGNRPGGGVVSDSRRFAPILLDDHVNAEGNFETIDGVTFLSAHTVGVSVGLTTADDDFQPDYMIFDEVGWDVPGFQNQRVRDLFIAFGTLGNTQIDIFGLYYGPATNEVHEVVIGTTLGCDIVGGAGTCTNNGIVGNTAIFKIVHDVDFLVGVDPDRSPCAHLRAAYANGGIPDKDGNFITIDPFGRCASNPATLGQEFAVLSPPTRDIIGRSRHKHALNSSVVTLDFHGIPSQNGEYLNPTGIGHPEFVEINLAALQTPLIFAGEPWNMDRRLGPGGGCDGEPDCNTSTPIGDPSMRLEPFPFSDLDPGLQAAVPLVTGYIRQRDRTLSYYPLTGAQVMEWPPDDPAAEPITATLSADLLCAVSDVDTDSDGIIDPLDNCTLAANGPLLPDAGGNSQRDTDGDGFGNMCDADLNGSNVVDFSDFFLFRSVLGATASGVVPYTNEDHSDFNGDTVVNFSDFFIFRGMLGGTPGPSGRNP